ncbi:hypothetical protein QE439_001486 [Pedobacter agri]|nr:hypothetical protein [Pedobacter agri]
MNESDYKKCAFGMAFLFYHDIIIRRILLSLQKVEITIFLVSAEKIVIL